VQFVGITQPIGNLALSCSRHYARGFLIGVFMAKSKRKSIPKSIRFEVFKRDLFTCQYCGKKAPDVILEIDHIVPVSKGGDNSIENLVSACKDCNSGKSNKRLSELSEVEKSRKQIEELQEKKNMIDMIFQWKQSVFDAKDYEIDKFQEMLQNITGFEQMTFTDKYRKELKSSFRKFGLDRMIDSLQIAYESYFREDEKSFHIMVSKIIGIATNTYDEENNPEKFSMRKIYNTAKKLHNPSPRAFYSQMNKYEYNKEDEETILKILYSSYSISNFYKKLEEYYLER